MTGSPWRSTTSPDLRCTRRTLPSTRPGNAGARGNDHLRPDRFWDIQAPASGGHQTCEGRTIGKAAREDSERNLLVHVLGGPAVAAPPDVLPARAAQNAA